MSPPYERLRSLARWGDADETLLAEIAGCLAELADDPAGLVVACRRLLDHHRAWGPLWWLCSRVLAAARPASAAADALAEVAADSTFARLVDALPFPPDGMVAMVGWPALAPRLVTERPDLTVVSVALDPIAQGGPIDHTGHPPPRELDPAELAGAPPTHLLVAPPAMSERRALGPPGTAAVLATCPVRTRVWAVAPTGFVLPDRLLEAMAEAAALGEWISPERFDRVAGPGGLAAPHMLADRVDAPIAPELLRSLP